MAEEPNETDFPLSLTPEQTHINGKSVSEQLRTAAEIRQLGSVLLDRLQFMRQAGITFSGNRDLYETLGYARILTNKDFRDRYARGGIAGRVVDAFPNATWRGDFEIIEDDSAKVTTPFEQAWDDLYTRLKIKAVLRRADVLAGLSTYSVLLIGAKGDLSTPLPQAKGQQDLLYLQPYSGGGGVNQRSQTTTVDCDVMIQEYETNPESPRFALPKTYQLRRTDFSIPAFNARVDWTRVIHVAEGILDDEVFGQPSLERVWNLLDDLEKVTGGGAEAFWLRANQGMQVNFDKEMRDLDPGEIEKLKANLEDYKNRIDRIIRTRGTDIKMLGSDVANFANPADGILTQIAGAKAIPKRILTGSEMGELASSQDRDNWKDQINGRQTSYCDPYIIRPLVDRLIQFGYLPTPKKGPEAYEVRWPHMQVLTEDEKSKGALAWAQTNVAQIQAGQKPVYTSDEIRDHWHQFDPLSDTEIKAAKNPAPPEPINPTTGAKPSTPQPQPVSDHKGNPLLGKDGKPVFKAAEYSYSSTQVNMPEDVASEVLSFGRNIPNDELAATGRETQPHVTVKYGIETTNPYLALALLQPESPVGLTLGPVSHFTHHDYDVVYVSVQSECLQRLHEFIGNSLATKDEHKDYTPHLTIAYVQPGLGQKYDGMLDFAGKQLTIDTIWFMPKGGDPHAIPLTGLPKAAENREMLEVLAEAIETQNTPVIDRILGIDRTLGGQGSGDFGHAGRPGEIGGSSGATAGFREPKSNADKQRLKDLKVPPQWTNVHINPDPKGRLQVVGIDSKGRRQSIYSAEHHAKQSAEKFDRLNEFNQIKPKLDSQINRDIKRSEPEIREPAAVLKLINETGFRIGGEGDTKAEKQAYGALTLRAKHVKIIGDEVNFRFTGKKGVTIEKTIQDRELAKFLEPLVKAGGRLFDTNYFAVRDYLKEHAPGFTAKDFRTWHGTSLALKAMRKMATPDTAEEFKSSRNKVASLVASHLGNTPKVALRSYIAPEVWDRWDTRGRRR